MVKINFINQANYKSFNNFVRQTRFDYTNNIEKHL